MRSYASSLNARCRGVDSAWSLLAQLRDGPLAVDLGNAALGPRRRSPTGRLRGQSLHVRAILPFIEMQLWEYQIRHGQTDEWVSQ